MNYFHTEMFCVLKSYYWKRDISPSWRFSSGQPWRLSGVHHVCKTETTDSPWPSIALIVTVKVQSQSDTGVQCSGEHCSHPGLSLSTHQAHNTSTSTSHFHGSFISDHSLRYRIITENQRLLQHRSRPKLPYLYQNNVFLCWIRKEMLCSMGGC